MGSKELGRLVPRKRLALNHPRLYCAGTIHSLMLKGYSWGNSTQPNELNIKIYSAKS